MSNFKDVLKGFFRDDSGEDDYVLPLDESGKLIRPMGTVKAVAHSFKTRSRSGSEPGQGLPEKLPLDDESRALLEIANAVRDKAYLMIDEDAESVFSIIRDDYNGVLPFDDKADPEQIREVFGLSKAAFKRAVGRLYKERVIAIEDGRIYTK